MVNKTFVFGHTKPDTDSIASAISMANLQTQLGNTAESFRLGNINKETSYALKSFNIPEPQFLDQVNSDSNVIMVDANEFSQSVNGIENAKIKMVVDHHRVNMQTNEPVHYIAEPVGCTSTIIYKLYKQNEVDITPDMAGLMLSAIVSDTLLFKSPTCTAEDKRIAEKLANIANVDLYEYGQKLLKAGTDISDYTSKEVINIDSKKFDSDNGSFVISQINTADLDDVFAKQTDLEEAIKSEIDEKDLALYVFVATDILNANSKVIALGNKADVIEKAYGVKLDNNTALLEGVVSRKKQVLPQVLANI